MSEDLLVLVDDPLVDTVARCAAAAGYRAVRGDPRSCRREWLTARAVIVDAAAVDALGFSPPARRRGVIVVGGRGGPGEDGGVSAATLRRAIGFGAEHTLSLPAEEAALVGVLTELLTPVRRRAAACAVIGGHGGAGASTLAATVALASADRGSSTVLLDVDATGPGLDLILGMESHPGVRWQDLTVAEGSVSGDVLWDALPRRDARLAVLSPRRDDTRAIRPESVAAVLDAARTHGDVVIVDLPRADTGLSAAVLDSVDLTVVITTASLSGSAASRALSARVADRCAHVELVVRGPSPSGLRPAAIADAVGLPLLVSAREQRVLAGQVERGRLGYAHRSPIGRAARAVLDRMEALGRVEVTGRVDVMGRGR